MKKGSSQQIYSKARFLKFLWSFLREPFVTNPPNLMANLRFPKARPVLQLEGSFVPRPWPIFHRRMGCCADHTTPGDFEHLEPHSLPSAPILDRSAVRQSPFSSFSETRSIGWKIYVTTHYFSEPIFWKKIRCILCAYMCTYKYFCIYIFFFLITHV